MPYRFNAFTGGFDLVPSLEGVGPDPQANLDLVEADAITITPDDANDQITIGEDHSGKTDNPHSVTHSQVGAPTDNPHSVTHSQVGSPSDNPHSVNDSQTGAADALSNHEADVDAHHSPYSLEVHNNSYHSPDYAVIEYPTIQVYNGTPPDSTWVALDLSGYVGSNRALVLLTFFNSGDNAWGYHVRSRGITAGAGAFEFTDFSNARGESHFKILSGKATHAVVMTDDEGYIDFRCEGTPSTIIDLEAYIKVGS